MLLPVMLAAFSSHASAQLPYTRTPASELSPPGLEHHEVLRIGRDFGDRNFKVVVDTWVADAAPGRLDEVRFWWVDGGKSDERSPFGRKLRKYIGTDFELNAPDDWTVTLRGDRKEFAFDVELDHGDAAAYGNIVTDDGTRIEHCRATSSRFVARRFLGIPIGIKRLDVTCLDDMGILRRGELPYRKLPRGALWEDD